MTFLDCRKHWTVSHDHKFYDGIPCIVEILVSFEHSLKLIHSLGCRQIL